MTPLYQECERVKETCAQLAIENAALTAHNAKLTGAVSALRGELTAGSEGEVAAVAGLRNVLVSLGTWQRVESGHLPVAPARQPGLLKRFRRVLGCAAQ